MWKIVLSTMLSIFIFSGCTSNSAVLKNVWYRSLISIENTSQRVDALFNDEKIPLPILNDSLYTELSSHLDTYYQTPEEYIISKFTNYDIVFLGEAHYIKQNVELIHRIIPELYENGIYNLGIEFANREDQDLIDSVIYAENYYDELSKIIMAENRTWGYREYLDIIKTVWELNSQLPNSARKFRLIGLNGSVDWSHVKTEEDLNNPDIRKKVWGKGLDYAMAETIIDELIEKNEKGLIFAGSNHTFTKYFQPKRYIAGNPPKEIIELNKERMGNLVYNTIGDKAFTIYLHGLWPNAKGWNEQYVYPVDGVIDALMKTQKYPVGFDVINSPFEYLKGDSSYFKYGYDDFTLSDFCDGYIFLVPFPKMKNVQWIKNCINEHNISKIKTLIKSPAARNGTISDEVMINYLNYTKSYRLSRENNIEWHYRMFE